MLNKNFNQALDNTNFTLERGVKPIQEMAEIILNHQLYRDEKDLNFVIAQRGTERPLSDYVRTLSYVLLKDARTPIALCMIVECPSLAETLDAGDLSFHADSFFSVLVNEHYRGRGIATYLTGELAKFIGDSLEKKAKSHSRYFVAADPNGAQFARKYFDVPFICAGFSISKAVKRVVIRYTGADVPEDDHYFAQPGYVESLQQMEREFERCQLEEVAACV